MGLLPHVVRMHLSGRGVLRQNRRMLRSGLLFLALLAGLAGVCGDGTRPGREPATIPADLTLEQVYERMELALLREGQILHSTATYERTAGPPEWSNVSYRSETWVEPSGEAARQASTADGTERTSAGIIRGTAVFRGPDDDEASSERDALTCRGTDNPVLASFLGCKGFTEESKTQLDVDAMLNGRPVVAVVSDGTSHGSDENFAFVDRLYVDPGTWLAIQLVSDGTVDYGEVHKLDSTITFEHEFVPASSLPDDFFDPASIGYVERDPAADLQPDVGGMRVYWLGREFDPGTGIAPLELILAGTGPSRPGYNATVSYQLKGGQRGSPIISLQEYPLDGWEALNPELGGHIWNADGATREEIALTDGRAVLIRIPSYYERYIAQVYFETTVVLVADHDQPEAYSTRKAFLQLIRGLRPYDEP